MAKRKETAKQREKRLREQFRTMNNGYTQGELVPWELSGIIDDQEARIRELEKRLEELEARFPKKKGKPERDEIILRLHAEEFTPSQIARHPDVVAAEGKKMKRQAVQNIIKRKAT